MPGSARTTLASATPEWEALRSHQAALAGVHLRDLFADDPGRGDRMVVQAGDLHIDLAKHRATDETIRLLVRLAEARDVTGGFGAMFAGERINATEGRSVLHTALRRRRRRAGRPGARRPRPDVGLRDPRALR